MAHAATIFLSSFLLFLVQPLIARLILPWFGGSAAVWTTCMLFFQVLLLGGYAYAHALNAKLRGRGQAIVHTLLLAAAVACLPIAPAESWKPAGGDEPVSRILLLLGATVGLPYFLLAATSPLLQAWYVRAKPHRRSFSGPGCSPALPLPARRSPGSHRLQPARQTAKKALRRNRRTFSGCRSRRPVRCCCSRSPTT